MKKLQIAKTLALPIDAATQTFAFIARKGAGKTYTAGKLVELLADAGVQVVILDTVGNWYGLRLAADGKGKGLDIPVLGGLRGDIPLDPAGGALIADIVVDTGRSLVLDASQWSKADRQRFAAAFGERLWLRKKSERHPSPVHLVLEESQLIIPQDVRGDTARMFGVFEEIIRLGRNYGIGVSMITQRPQSVNKEVLNMAECLFVGQVNGPQERDALKKWMTQQGGDVKLVEELPKLPIGTFYVWSPQWLQLLERVEILAKRTYDASATPKVGDKRVQRDLQPLDLSALQEKMAATIEKAKADDPRELKRQIQALQQEVAKFGNNRAATSGFSTSNEHATAAKDAPKALTDADRALIEKLASAIAARTAHVDGWLSSLEVTAAAAVQKAVADYMNEARSVIAKFATDLDLEKPSVKKLLEKLNGLTGAPPPVQARPVAKTITTFGSAMHPARTRSAGEDTQTFNVLGVLTGAATGDLTKGEATVLTAIAQHGDAGCTREQITVLTGYKRSTRDLYLQQLGRRGAVNASRDAITATPEGVAMLGPSFKPLPTGAELRQHWLSTLPQGERRVLEEAIDVYPKTISRDELTAKTEYKRSTRDLYVQLLQRRKLVTTDRAGVRASDTLFD